MTDIALPSVDVNVPIDGLTLGQAAAVMGITSETLRYYDRAGLLRTPTPRDSGGRRRFYREDLEWIAAVLMLRETGMPISGIRHVAELSRRPGTERERLDVFVEHRRHVRAMLARTRTHLEAIERKIAAYRAALTEEEEEE